MLTAAAKLVYLCGFMCFDDQLQGAAQQYYTISLRLAAEALHASSYAITLRAMSVQAHLLGHRQHAADLAEAAVRTAPAGTPGPTQAFLLGQLAVTLASTGDRRGALNSLSTAENHLSRTEDAPLVGACHQASLEHQHSAVAAGLGDRHTAIAALERSIRCRPVTERRSRAITSARLAELQTDEGRLEQACSTWHEFLDDYPHLESRRADSALAVLRARTRHHRNIPAVQALHRRATAIWSGPPRSSRD